MFVAKGKWLAEEANKCPYPPKFCNIRCYRNIVLRFKRASLLHDSLFTQFSLSTIGNTEIKIETSYLVSYNLFIETGKWNEQ